MQWWSTLQLDWASVLVLFVSSLNELPKKEEEKEEENHSEEEREKEREEMGVPKSFFFTIFFYYLRSFTLRSPVVYLEVYSI